MGFCWVLSAGYLCAWRAQVSAEEQERRRPCFNNCSAARAHVLSTFLLCHRTPMVPLIAVPEKSGASSLGYMCTHWSESGTSPLGGESSSGLLSPSEAESGRSSSESPSDSEGNTSDALLHFSIIGESLVGTSVLSAYLPPPTQCVEVSFYAGVSAPTGCSVPGLPCMGSGRVSLAASWRHCALIGWTLLPVSGSCEWLRNF